MSSPTVNDLTQHCSICNHQLIDYQIGTVCGITKQKPNFNNRCLDIDFSVKVEEKIKDVNMEYEAIKRSSKVIYAYSIVYGIIALIIICGSYYLGSYVFNKGRVFAIPFVLGAAGIAVLQVSISTYRNHKNELSIRKKRKDKLDNIIDRYDMEYQIELKFGKEIHGTRDIHSDLKLQRKR